jgi:hypothetical protein
MTLPTSGTITMQNFNTELGLASTAQNSMSFIYSVTTPQNSTAYNFAHYYGFAYFKNTTQGNCNNANCACGSNCGDINCGQCVASQCVNCANCQATNFLQANCNCACTYNCNAVYYTVNCANCACACACGGRC